MIDFIKYLTLLMTTALVLPSCGGISSVNLNSTGNSQISVSTGTTTLTISSFSDINTVFSSPILSQIVSFILGGSSALSCSSSLSVSSSNAAVIPASAISFSGTYPNCKATLNISAIVTGTSIIKLTASIGSASVSQQFKVIVSECNSSSTPFGGGLGTSSSPYLICSATQLQNINTNSTTLSDYYLLQSNIDLTSASWTPIGSITTPFSGSFNGYGFTLSNLTVNQPTTTQVGLFSDVSGSIQNLTLSNFLITGNSYVGALTGQQESGSTFSSVTVSGGSVASAGGGSFAGGLVGMSYGSVINCSSSASIDGGGTSLVLGGLIGQLQGGVVTHSNSTGNVSNGGFGGGGLIGALSLGSSVSTSYATGNVSGNGTAHGGLIGQVNDTGQVTNCYATGSVSSNGQAYTGGLIGAETAVGATPIINSYATGAVSSAGSQHGGIVGIATGTTTFQNTFWNSVTTGQLTPGTSVSSGYTQVSTTVLMQTQSTFVGFDFTNVWYPPAVGVSYPTLR